MSAERNETGKDAPAGAPDVPAVLAAKVEQGIDDPERARDLRVDLLVEGGAPGERYEFHYQASGSGEATAQLRDDIGGRRSEPGAAELKRSEFVDLLRALDVNRLAQAAAERPPIPPDSLVGRLEVTDGEQRVTAVFMADREQAKSAGYELPAEVAAAVERIYDLAAKPLGEKDPRP